MKRIDFQVARELFPARNVLREGPKLTTLVRGKAIGGPCDGAVIDAPYRWNGEVRRNGIILRGRYVFDMETYTWEWRGEPYVSRR